MAVWAILFVMLILGIVLLCGPSFIARFLILQVLVYLSGFVLGIIITAMCWMALICYQQKSNKTALRMEGWKILDALVPAVQNTANIVRNEEKMVVVAPSQCHVKIETSQQPQAALRQNAPDLPHGTQHENITTLVVHTECDTNTILSQQSRKSKMNRDLKFTPGNSLIKTENNTVSVKNGCEVVALDQHRLSPRNPSQLESFC